MPLAAAKFAMTSASKKLGVAAGCTGTVPGKSGQTVRGFMAFSAVMLLKCLSSSAESVALTVEAGSMAAPIGKLTTPNFAASVVLSAGALAGLGSWGVGGPPLPGGGCERFVATTTASQKGDRDRRTEQYLPHH